MKAVNVIKTLFVIGTMSGSLAWAGPDDGVKCPSGYQTNFNESTKVMICKDSDTEYATTICPADAHHYIQRNGRDYCNNTVELPFVGEVPAGHPTRRSVSCIALPDGQSWSLDIDGAAGNRDRCKRTKVKYAYPQQR